MKLLYRSLLYVLLFLASPAAFSMDVVPEKNSPVEANSPLIRQKTATESYLSHSHWGARMTRFLKANEYKPGGKNERAYELVEEIKKREIEFGLTHEVIYRARHRDYVLYSDLDEMRNKQSNCHNPLNLDAFFASSDKKIFDRNNYIKHYKAFTSVAEWQSGDKDSSPQDDYMQSVNFSLFGNMDRAGECTWVNYFMGNFEDGKKRIILAGVHENIDPKLRNLFNKYYSNKSGELIQIFIPKELVNQLIFVAENNSIGVLENDEGRMTAKIDPNFPDTAKLIAAYRSNPEDFFTKEQFNSFQGRLFFRSPLMSAPESGIKIFRYNTITDKDRAEYLQELSLIDISFQPEMTICDDPLAMENVLFRAEALQEADEKPADLLSGLLAKTNPQAINELRDELSFFFGLGGSSIPDYNDIIQGYIKEARREGYPENVVNFRAWKIWRSDLTRLYLKEPTKMADRERWPTRHYDWLSKIWKETNPDSRFELRDVLSFSFGAGRNNRPEYDSLIQDYIKTSNSRRGLPRPVTAFIGEEPERIGEQRKGYIKDAPFWAHSRPEYTPPVPPFIAEEPQRLGALRDWQSDMTQLPD